MQLLSNFLNLCGLWVAGYTGFNSLGLHFIVIAALILMIAWMTIRVDVCIRNLREYGKLIFIFKFIPIQIFTYSILSGIIYAIAYGIGFIVS
jgi:hypothetical protein